MPALWTDKNRLSFRARRGRLVLAATLLAMALPALSHAAEFPQMQVQTLSGVALDLPRQFAAGPSVVLIVYDQNQQPQAQTWVPFLSGIAETDPAARYYLMPILPAGLSIMRGMVEDIIRATAAEGAQLDRTILLFTDVEALQRELGISGLSAVHVLVLDDTGQVVATAAGAYSPQTGQQVANALLAASPLRDRSATPGTEPTP